MGNVVRPNKPVGGSGGASWVDGNRLPAAELNADIDTLITDYNSNITDGNIAAAAAIQGTKLADSAISTVKIANLAVDSTKLATDAVTTAKILAANVTMVKLNITTYSHAPALGAIASNGSSAIDTGLSTTTTHPFLVYHVNASNLPVYFTVMNRGGTWKVLVYNTSDTISATLNANDIKVAYFS